MKTTLISVGVSLIAGITAGVFAALNNPATAVGWFTGVFLGTLSLLGFAFFTKMMMYGDWDD